MTTSPMNKDTYLTEVEKRLLKIFTASKEGYKVPPEQRHRLEGFMQAGVFMGAATNAELAALMGKLHMQVFAVTISQRKTELASRWDGEAIDYGQYEQPTYERVGK